MNRNHFSNLLITSTILLLSSWFQVYAQKKCSTDEVLYWYDLNESILSWANNPNSPHPCGEIIYITEHLGEIPQEARDSLCNRCSEFMAYKLSVLNEPRYEQWQKENATIEYTKHKLIVDILSGSSDAFLDFVRKKSISTSTKSLFKAVSVGDIEGVVEALNDDANILALNEQGLSVLHSVRNTEIAELLIEKGANVNIRESKSLMTPLFFQDEALLRLLIEFGANVNALSVDGNSPLLWYTYSNFTDGIELVLQHGADLTKTNFDGNSIREIAEKFGSQEFQQYIQSLLASNE